MIEKIGKDYSPTSLVTSILIYESRALKMKVLGCHGIFFFINFDLENSCKNELKDDNEKSCS